MMKFSCNKLNLPLGGLITAEYVKLTRNVQFEISFEAETIIKDITCRTSNDLARAIAKYYDSELRGSTPLEVTEINHWMTFCLGPLTSKNEFSNALEILNKSLAPVTYLVGKRITIADFVVFATLYQSSQWNSFILKKNAPTNILRWYNFISSQQAVKNVLNNLPAEIKSSLTNVEKSTSGQSVEKTSSGRAKEGKFVELPGAELGKVVVRFPPEASGYLHIGHAKAALLNQYYQEVFQGKLIMRFDDTNPAKENVHFEKVILEDVEMLDIKPDMFSHSSQYFDLMLQYCEKLLKEGKAYVDDTEAELMKMQREQKIESPNRNNSVENNFQLWEEMKKGTEKGQQCCVRAKIDMQSPNGCLRDPTIYRCKNEPHPRTGTQYKVYPTYDFACPIVDSVEGVTHTLRTMEYHDRDPQFYWFIEVLGLRKPYIWEYSRLSMTNTVLSKRKLTWFVEQGLVDGWDDPRMPTVRGVLRRGMTVQGLKEFIIAQGSSRSVVFMEWDKIWAFNKKVIDPIAPRYTALEYDNVVPILIKGNIQVSSTTAPLHPKNPEVGNKQVWISSKILIDTIDVELLKEGENATFINWGNLLIKKINRMNGKVENVEAEPNLDNKDYKKTPKLTWLAEVSDVAFTPTYCVYFDHLISKPLLGKDEDFKQYVGHQTRREVRMLGDPELKNLKKNDIIQLQRRGFFRVDVAYKDINPHTGREQSIILFSIPDGHVNDNPLGFTKEPEKKMEVGTTSAKPTATVTPHVAGVTTNENSLLEQITLVGNKVRELKANKAAKNIIDTEVKNLLSLKADYKTLTGKDWKPTTQPSASAPSVAPMAVKSNETDLLETIATQGEKVRQLKTDKADKAKVDAEVKILLDLKANFKTLTGKDWKPGMKPISSAAQNDSIVCSSPLSQGNLSENDLLELITVQGDKVRQLKTDKADKSKIDEEVKKLLELKANFKTQTGNEWKPGMKPSATTIQNNSIVSSSPSQGNSRENDLLEQIVVQGDKVRQLKTDKADKSKVDEEVKKLLELKANFKTQTGKEWKPGMKPSATTIQNNSIVSTSPSQGNSSENDLLEQIVVQGDRVRQLKADKSDNSKIDEEVKKLLELKANFKSLTGQEWKPGMKSEAKPIEVRFEDSKIADLTAKITEQGNLVRDLKTKKDTKEHIDSAVKILLELKSQYKDLTGSDFLTTSRTSSKPKTSTPTATPKEKNSKQKPAAKGKKPVDVEKEGGGLKKQTRLGLEAKKEENLSDWYSQVITKGEMIEYYDVSGCYIFRPWSFSIWEAIKDWFDAEIKKLGVQNCYFPIFVSRAALEKEKTHIADFAPEVAWVTKSGDSDMAEPIAVRPTSETVMYPAYAKWIQSYRDLPIKLNQWNNVVRWEFKHPQPFLRTREFLWQEGHTAFADKTEADIEVTTILDLYARVYTDLLAIPVVKGRKTEKEKFAGGDYTLTVEAFVAASGRGIQGATSHHLGQNFSKMFDITYEDPETQEKKFVYQNSWGITTRTIGVMIMVHADNQGLVLPPRVAAIQVVIVPCGVTVGLSEAEKNKLQDSCDALENDLKKIGINVKGDYRMNYSPGWKFNHWELKGVPVRVEIGPKDIEKDQLVAVRRDSGEKFTILRRNAVEKLRHLLDDIQDNLLKKAQDELNKHMITVTDWEQFSPNLDNKNILLAPFCGESSCEDKIKADSARDETETAEPGAPAMGAKSLCIPLEQPTIQSTDRCIHPDCTKKPQFYTLFGRSY